MDPHPQPDGVDLSTAQGVADAFLTQAVTPASLKGVTPEQLDFLYAAAWQQLADGQPAQAVDDLMLLVSHEPWDGRFQFAYGLALQALGQPQAAGQHYALALLLDATDAACIFRMGECLAALGDDAQAAEAWRACIQLSWLKPEHHLVRAQAEEQLAALAAVGAA